MDSASAFGAEGSGFESQVGRQVFLPPFTANGFPLFLSPARPFLFSLKSLFKKALTVHYLTARFISVGYVYL